MAKTVLMYELFYGPECFAANGPLAQEQINKLAESFWPERETFGVSEGIYMIVDKRPINRSESGPTLAMRFLIPDEGNVEATLSDTLLNFELYVGERLGYDLDVFYRTIDGKHSHPVATNIRAID